ncbi:MAG TPA: hypothetical protein PK472_18995, partial [Pseudomonadota bacterium]|nr:hypothetical protein [Pseudomonadota bacterium]
GSVFGIGACCALSAAACGDTDRSLVARHPPPARYVRPINTDSENSRDMARSTFRMEGLLFGFSIVP